MRRSNFINTFSSAVTPNSTRAPLRKPVEISKSTLHRRRTPMSTAKPLDLPEDTLKAHGEVASEHLKPASNFKRVAAFFIDIMIGGACAALVGELFQMITADHTEGL